MAHLDGQVLEPSGNDGHFASAKDVRTVARGVTGQARGDALARLIEADIIPRLMIASESRASQLAFTPKPLDIDAHDIDDFAQMMIGLDLVRANHVVSAAISRGVAIETIMLDLFAATAARLGDMWTDDQCTFTEVTVGLCTLQNLLRAYTSGETDVIPRAAGTDCCALLAATPGEQHTFGVLMLETFFRRAGWNVFGMPLTTMEEILTAVSRRSFAIVGLSLSREEAAPALRQLVDKVRLKSRNREIVVMVGGRAFIEKNDLASAVGADLTASDGHEAVVASQHILWSTVKPQLM